MLRHPWPQDIITELVSETNPWGILTKSNFELATLVLHDTTLL